MNDVCSNSSRPVGREPGSLGPYSQLGKVDPGFVYSLTERLKLIEQLRAASGLSHTPAVVKMGFGPRPIFSTAGMSQQALPVGRRYENGTKTRNVNGARVIHSLPNYASAVMKDMMMKDCLVRIKRSCETVADNLPEIKEDLEDEASEDNESRGLAKRLPRCVRIRCKYCGQISTDAELTVYRKKYDPHSPRHRQSGKEKLPNIPVGLSERSGRCFFCYAPFPQTSLAVPRQDTDFDTNLSWEYNPRALKYRKKNLDSFESSLRYRVLMRNTGLLPCIEGKISDKIPKKISDRLSDN